ncbi:alpha/beta hydrolase [Aegicerativicinus sediminis]
MKKILPLIFLCFSTLLFAQVKTTHTYAIKGGDTLKLDLYVPENFNGEGKLPLLLWMHGGGFSGGQRDNENEVQLFKYTAENGIIAASISYRLTRKGKKTGFGCNCDKKEKIETFRQAAIDYLDAANYLVSKSDDLPINPSKIIAGGSSAGAEAVLSAVFMREFYIKDLDKYNKVSFVGVWSLAGALVNADYITKANAVPTILFHGTKDNAVPFSTDSHHFCNKNSPGYLILNGSKPIADKLKSLNTSFYLNIVQDGGHEVSGIPFQDLENVFEFINIAILSDEKVQTTITKESSN